MSPEEQVMIALHGGHTKQVPFTMYANMLPRCRTERELRNRGLCVVERVPVIKTYTPNCTITQEEYDDNGRTLRRYHIKTPVGDLTYLQEVGGFTTWTHEKLFKTPDDYKKLLFLIQDECYAPDYTPVVNAMKQAAGAETDLDYIEAFTPAPDTDMSLIDAHQAWPDKVLWLNFPSSSHLKSNAVIKEQTVALLDELNSIDGIIMGITEDIPAERWQQSCTAIIDGLKQHSITAPELYRRSI